MNKQSKSDQARTDLIQFVQDLAGFSAVCLLVAAIAVLGVMVK